MWLGWGWGLPGWVCLQMCLQILCSQEEPLGCPSLFSPCSAGSEKDGFQALESFSDSIKSLVLIYDAWRIGQGMTEISPFFTHFKWQRSSGKGKPADQWIQRENDQLSPQKVNCEPVDPQGPPNSRDHTWIKSLPFGGHRGPVFCLHSLYMSPGWLH